jgi:hypothetical protein
MSKPKIELVFNSLDIHKRYHLVDRFSLELKINGETVMIDIGPSGERTSDIHINGPIGLKVDHHSSNALDIYFPKKQAQP